MMRVVWLGVVVVVATAVLIPLTVRRFCGEGGPDVEYWSRLDLPAVIGRCP
jgi:hypothetical protein